MNSTLSKLSFSQYKKKSRILEANLIKIQILVIFYFQALMGKGPEQSLSISN